MKRFIFLPAILLLSVALSAQTNSGGLRLHVDDLTGRPVAKADVHLRSGANEYVMAFKTDTAGNLDLQHLPYGIYRLEINSNGLASFTGSVIINSPIPSIHNITMRVAPIQQTIAVTDTALNPEHARSVSEIGPTRTPRTNATPCAAGSSIKPRHTSGLQAECNTTRAFTSNSRVTMIRLSPSTVPRFSVASTLTAGGLLTLRNPLPF